MNYQLTRNKFLAPEERFLLERVLTRFPGRDATLISLALHTGARANELLKIQPSDLNDQLQTVFIHGSKGSKSREIPLYPEVYTLAKQYVPFGIKYRRLDQIWHQYRPVNKNFHSLRHTFAIDLYKRTKDIKLVQICLGHKSITSTQVYADFVYEQHEMRRLIISANI